jgi:uncharacterized membrane protein YcaP (DUF421 family)
MDPLRISVRVAFAYLLALVLTRISGSGTVKQTDATNFVTVLVIGDLFDDMLWSEVPASQFAVAMGTLFLTHLAASVQLFHGGRRQIARGAN